MKSLIPIVLLATFAGPVAAAAPAISLPVVIDAGRTAAASGAPELLDSFVGARRLADLPFSAERGYGFVGGWVGRREGAAVFGRTEELAGPLYWREGIQKYVVRVPRGKYRLVLGFAETEVAVAGRRVFEVRVEGKPLESPIDIAGAVGDFAWYSRSAEVAVYDGWLDVEFRRVGKGRPPRISRFALASTESTAEPVPPVPVLSAAAGPDCAVLRWPLAPEATGWEIERATSTGTFQPIAREVPPGEFLDLEAEAFTEYRYRIRAIGRAGAPSAWCEPVAVQPRAPHEFGLPVYALEIDPEELARISERRVEAHRARAVLRHLGVDYHVFVELDAGGSNWQRKKSFKIALDPEFNRFFYGRRRRFTLSAEAGDETLLRELLSRAASEAVGLATPRASPVVLMVNGAFRGVYLDLEKVGTRFRKRTSLEDRSGLLTQPRRGDSLHLDWEPYGKKVGSPGNLFSWTLFVHELNSIATGELAAFLRHRLYFDRFVERWALAALLGGEPRAIGDRLFLEDSRNRRWEWLVEHHRTGEWGISDFAPLRELTEAEARRSLFRRTVQSHAPDEPWSVLETRFLNRADRRALLAERIDARVSGELSPEAVDEMVDRIWARIGPVVDVDVGRPRFSAAKAIPARLKARYRRWTQLVKLAARELRADESAVLLNEIVAAPSSGAPWVELSNRGEGTTLEGFFLTNDPADPARVPLVGAIPPAGLFRLDIDPARLELSRDGGALFLFRRAGDSAFRLVDAVYYGRSTARRSYGRSRTTGDWLDFDRVTPGEPNAEVGLLPPPLSFRHSVEKAKEGALTLSILPRTEPSGAGVVERVEVLYRPSGDGAFESAPLAWDEKLHRYVTHLAGAPNRPRTDYYYRLTTDDGLERTFPLVAPRLTFALPVVPDVRINEVLPRPRRDTGQREFIELYNRSEQPVDVGGMFLSDRKRLPSKWRIPTGTIVPANGYTIFYADDRDGERHTSFSLSNSGEFLGLFTRMEEGLLPVDSVAFRGARAGQSWGRTQDGTKSFRVWKHPTPGAKNVPKVTDEELERFRRKQERAKSASGRGPRGEEPKAGDGSDPGRDERIESPDGN